MNGFLCLGVSQLQGWSLKTWVWARSYIVVVREPGFKGQDTLRIGLSFHGQGFSGGGFWVPEPLSQAASPLRSRIPLTIWIPSAQDVFSLALQHFIYCSTSCGVSLLAECQDPASKKNLKIDFACTPRYCFNRVGSFPYLFRIKMSHHLFSEVIWHFYSTLEDQKERVINWGSFLGNHWSLFAEAALVC